MSRLRPGWLLALCAAALAISSWLPWLTTSAGGGTVGSMELPPRFGAGQLIALLSSVLIVLGAMVGRDLSPRLAAVAALVLSVLVGILTWSYYHANVHPPVTAGYGFYVGAVCALAALLSSGWALAVALRNA